MAFRRPRFASWQAFRILTGSCTTTAIISPRGFEHRAQSAFEDGAFTSSRELVGWGGFLEFG